MYAKSIMAQITCLGCREALVTFRLLAPSLKEGWNKCLKEGRKERHIERWRGRKKEKQKFL